MSPNKDRTIDCNEAAYRLPLAVQKILILPGGYTYPVCPKCGITLEREYMSFCDRCGQRLDWREYKKAVMVKL